MASPASEGESPLGESLRAWVRSFERGARVQQLGELGDGKVLWAILQDVDPDYFADSLPEPDLDASSEWTRKWQNLKHLEKQLSIYYRDVCNGHQSAPDAAGAPDLKAIAAEAAVPELEKLIMEIIRAAMASPESNQRMGRRLLGLGNEHAMAIAYEIRSMQDAEAPGPDAAGRDEWAYRPEQELPPGTPERSARGNGHLFGDPLLEREEELLQAQATIEKLHARHAELQQQLQALRQDKEQLQEAFDAYRSEIETGCRKVGADDDLKKLQRQADNDRAYIDDLENQLQASRNSVESYERQIQKYKDEGEHGQKLRDDLQVLRAENEDLNQKVKANENLKKKIQALQEQDKANASLREELKLANDKLEDLDRLKHVQAALEKEIIEKKGLIRNQEYQINELTTTRKHAEYDARVLAQKLEAARERHERDHEAIEELRSQLRDEGIDEAADVDVPAPPPKDDAPADGRGARPSLRTADASRHLHDKIALLEKQLEAADARLQQASQRHAALEEEHTRLRDELAAQSDHARRDAELRADTIARLRRELDASRQKPPHDPPPPPPPDLAMLQRENRLMATAWYDLSSRLQNNGVSLGRRRPDPKSWIGKQRLAVGPHASGSSCSTR